MPRHLHCSLALFVCAHVSLSFSLSVFMCTYLRVICADVKILLAVKPFYFKLLLTTLLRATSIFAFNLSSKDTREGENRLIEPPQNLYAPNELDTKKTHTDKVVT